MPAPDSAPPLSARVEVVTGGALTGAGALTLVVHAGELPGFVVELLVGFTAVHAFWTILGAALLTALGVFVLVRGRRGIRRHRWALEQRRQEAVRAQRRAARPAPNVPHRPS